MTDCAWGWWWWWLSAMQKAGEGVYYAWGGEQYAEMKGGLETE